MTTDWRGTPIEPGRQVVYGAGVGRSIAPTEGVVEGFSASGKSVKVRVIRRAYGGYGGQEVVHVGSDKLTVVELPDSEQETFIEKYERAERITAERGRVIRTHDITTEKFGKISCTRCSTARIDLHSVECPRDI